MNFYQIPFLIILILVFIYKNKWNLNQYYCKIYICLSPNNWFSYYSRENSRSVIDPRDGQKVALKRIPRVFHNPITAKRVHRELKMLSCLKHENVSRNQCIDDCILDVNQSRVVNNRVYFALIFHLYIRTCISYT